MPQSFLDSSKAQERAPVVDGIGRVSAVLLVSAIVSYVVTTLLLVTEVQPIAVIYGALASTVSLALFGCIAAALHRLGIPKRRGIGLLMSFRRSKATYQA